MSAARTTQMRTLKTARNENKDVSAMLGLKEPCPLFSITYTSKILQIQSTFIFAMLSLAECIIV